MATHQEQFVVPYGQVVVRSGRLVEYREKPAVPLEVSSGTYVLSPSACRLITPRERTDAPQLIQRILEQGGLVASFAHQSAWIDVNDAQSVVRAERLVRQGPLGFEWWESIVPASRYVHTVFFDDDHFWVQAEDGLLPWTEIPPAAGAQGRPSWDWLSDSIDVERGEWRRDFLRRVRAGPPAGLRLERLRWEALHRHSIENNPVSAGTRLLAVLRSIREADQSALGREQAVLRRA